MTTAVTIFVRQMVRDKSIPFKITARPDPFYSDANMSALKRATKAADNGQLTAHELIEE